MTVEGDIGTWSHCGRRAVHPPHLHSFAMNEGPYTDIQCNGTPQPQAPRRLSKHYVDDLPADILDPQPVKISKTFTYKSWGSKVMTVEAERVSFEPSGHVAFWVGDRLVLAERTEDVNHLKEETE